MSTNIIESKLINNNIFFVIPSWGNLLGYPTLGNYAHHMYQKYLMILLFSWEERNVRFQQIKERCIIYSV